VFFISLFCFFYAWADSMPEDIEEQIEKYIANWRENGHSDENA
jgi:hypothetical protein